jgi:thiamine biosynthesis protein ThiS
MGIWITLNGKRHEAGDSTRLDALVDSLGLEHEHTVVERNGDIIERDRFGDIVLHDGDAVEIVRFVGGG